MSSPEPADPYDPSQMTSEAFDAWVASQHPAPTPAPTNPPPVVPEAATGQPEPPPFDGRIAGSVYAFGRTLGPLPAPTPGRPAGRI